jgi:hypothetical protein
MCTRAFGSTMASRLATPAFLTCPYCRPNPLASVAVRPGVPESVTAFMTSCSFSCLWRIIYLDVAGAIMAAQDGTGVDLLLGIGGTRPPASPTVT